MLEHQKVNVKFGSYPFVFIILNGDMTLKKVYKMWTSYKLLKQMLFAMRQRDFTILCTYFNE